MSKYLQQLAAYKAAFESIAFDPAALADNPEALAAHIAAQSTTGAEDYKARIETLEAENAVQFDALAAHVTDLGAANELLTETQEQLTQQTELATTHEAAAKAYASGIVDAGIKIEAKEGGAQHTPADIAKAITDKQSIHAAERLAAHGIKDLLPDDESAAADGSPADPYAGLTGISRTAAALKARRSNA